MDKAIVTQMREKLIEWLDEEFPFMRAVEPFDGAWTEADIETRITTTPALYVSWLGNVPARGAEKRHTWSIILFMTTNNSQQTPEDRAVVDSIIEYIELKLHKKRFKNEGGHYFGALEHAGSKSLWHASPRVSGFTLYAIDFTQEMYSVIDDEDDIDDFLTYYEKVCKGDLTLIETLAKPNEPFLKVEINGEKHE